MYHYFFKSVYAMLLDLKNHTCDGRCFIIHHFISADPNLRPHFCLQRVCLRNVCVYTNAQIWPFIVNGIQCLC